MSSDVEICNLALSNIRAGSINSFDEPSLQAQQCKLKFSTVRDRVLSESNWSFNRKIKAPALLQATVLGWAYSYRYPVDCILVRRIIPAHELNLIDPSTAAAVNARRVVSYEVFNVDGSQVLCTNEPDIHLDYSAIVTDPNLFSADFILGMSHLLAAELAIPIVGAENGRVLRADSIKLYQSFISSASADSMNDRFSPQVDSDFVTCR